MRLLFYCHDATGLAHMRHDMAVAGHLVGGAPRPSVLFAVGTDEFSRVTVPAGVEILKLPGLPDLGGRRDARQLGLPGQRLVALRAGVLATVTRSYRPDVLVVDRDPLGPCGELRPALDALRALGRRSAFAVGRVPGDAETAMRDWPAAWHEAVTRYYDRVLVSGPRRALDALGGAGWPAASAERIRYCGEVDAPAHAAALLLELGAATRAPMTLAADRVTADAA